MNALLRQVFLICDIGRSFQASLQHLHTTNTMASASRVPIPIKAIFAGIAGSISAATYYGIKRSGGVEKVLKSFFTGPGSYSRIVALMVVLFNFKNFPFVWTYRVFNGIFAHMEFANTKHFEPTKAKALTKRAPHGPAALFQPIITHTYAPLSECDYNMHKSNSTYFSDLDVSRSHLVTCLLRQGIRSIVINPGQVIMPDGSKAKGKWFIMLGAVMCNFKREIPMYAGYEMWSRVLCWDRKWIYILTHFVKKGAVRPDGYTLDDGSFRSRFLGARGKEPVKEGYNADWEATLNKNVYASALSKYCCKIGRFTIHPEVTMNASGLLPPKPGGWNIMDGKQDVQNGSAENGSTDAVIDSEEWDWKRVEAENQRGLKFAEHFAAMEELTEEFSGEDRPALGVFRDLF